MRFANALAFDLALTFEPAVNVSLIAVLPTKYVRPGYNHDVAMSFKEMQINTITPMCPEHLDQGLRALSETVSFCCSAL